MSILNTNFLKSYVDTKKGIEIRHQNDNKNYLYTNNQKISLPNGVLCARNGVILINEEKICLEDYIEIN